MGRVGKRDALAITVIAVVSGVLFAWPSFGLRGLSLDILTALRWQVFGNRYDAMSAPAVVVVLDEESYQTPPFRGSPTLTWTREIGRVLAAIVEGGAKVVGFDIVFPASIEQSEIPFGDASVGTRLRGFDRDFLRALAAAANAEKLVLGEVLHRDQPLLPSPGQRIAVGQQRNIRPLNVYNDPDDIVRRLPLTFSVDAKPVPSMAVELASRALNSVLEVRNGTMTLAGYQIPGVVPNTMTVNFDGGAEDIPTFSFADLRACAENDNKEYFRKYFNGKVVLFGTLLDEDQKITSKRFATGLERAWTPRCGSSMRPTNTQFKRASISGVYIHATAVNNLIRRDVTSELSSPAVAAVGVAFAFLAALLMLRTTPFRAVLSYLAIAVVSTAGATGVFMHSLALPVVEPFFAGVVAMVFTVAFRYIVVEKKERFLRKSFTFYLPPKVIDKMLASDALPALGGEIRNVSVFFSDIAGFTSISEKMAPTTLVALLNDYLSAMTDIIEDNGGSIDKYIGDSIVAIFGAPADDPEHASNAVRAALYCEACLEELNRTSGVFQGHKLQHRIGVNSGEALVGNIGSGRRFNYTVISDAVNLASRLEGANKYFGTSIMVSEMTVSLTGTKFAWRELDAVRVKGREQPIKIYEPLAESGQQTSAQSLHTAAYTDGLARWRAGDFRGAIECFEHFADVDPPSARFMARVREAAEHPSGPDWKPVYTLEGK